MPSDLAFSAAAERNREPILKVLRSHFGDRRHVLEIGSGTAQHAVHFAAAFPQLTWQCSDRAPNIDGIRQRLRETALPNTPEPLIFDVAQARWPELQVDAVFSANTLHIMGWPEVEQLFACLPTLLSADARLAIYGPFHYGGRPTSDSNAAFDESLRAQSPHMGIRDFEQVDALAQAAGFSLIEDCAMPANNRCLVWRRP